MQNGAGDAKFLFYTAAASSAFILRSCSKHHPPAASENPTVWSLVEMHHNSQPTSTLQGGAAQCPARLRHLSTCLLADKLQPCSSPVIDRLQNRQVKEGLGYLLEELAKDQSQYCLYFSSLLATSSASLLYLFTSCIFRNTDKWTFSVLFSVDTPCLRIYSHWISNHIRCNS